MYLKIQYLITHYDLLGRIISTQTPTVNNGWITTSNFYDGATDRLLRTTRTGEPDTLYLYNEMGELTTTAVDVNSDGLVPYSGSDRITRNTTSLDKGELKQMVFGNA